MKRSFVIALVVLCAAVYAQSQTSVRRSIEANTRQFIEALNKGDAAAVASLYAMNARVLPPNSPMIQGRANIQSFWQGAITGGMKMNSLDIVDLDVQGNTAIEVGRYTATMPGGVADTGKYVVVWKRQGRAWKLAVDTFNSDRPTTP